VLVVLELVAEAGGEEFVFDVDADLGAYYEDQDRWDEEDWGRDHEASAEKKAEHRRVDGVAEEAVGAGADECVIGAEGCVEAEMTAEGAGAGEGPKGGEGEEKNREGDAPGGWRGGPEMALPDEYIGCCLKHQAPAGAVIGFLRGVAVPSGDREWEEPQGPPDREDDVSVGWHGPIVRPGSLPARVRGA
jgi:hypothetical protein